jgi:hypothetical protein
VRARRVNGEEAVVVTYKNRLLRALWYVVAAFYSLLLLLLFLVGVLLVVVFAPKAWAESGEILKGLAVFAVFAGGLAFLFGGWDD